MSPNTLQNKAENYALILIASEEELMKSQSIHIGNLSKSQIGGNLLGLGMILQKLSSMAEVPLRAGGAQWLKSH